MIKSFKCKETEKIHRGLFFRRIPRNLQRLAARKLEMLAAASELKSLRIPSSHRIEKIKGDRLGLHSIKVSDQWRIYFALKTGDAHDVEIVDYH